MTPVSRASAAYFVYFVGIGALWPYLPVYYRHLGLDLGAIGLLAATAAFVSLIASPVWGWLNDRFPESRLVLASAPAIAAVAGLALASAVGLPAIVVCVVALYLALAGIGPMLDARTVDMLGADRTRYGRVRALGSASFVFASLLVGVVIDRTSVVSLFAVWVPVVALAAVVMLTLPTRPRGRSVSLFRGAADLLGRRDLALFFAGSLLVFSALAAANSFFSVYVVSLGEPAQLVGLAWAMGAVVEVAVMWNFPALAGRVGLPALLVLGSAGFAVRAAGVALVASPAGLLITMLVEGFAFGAYFTGGVMFVSQRAPRSLGATAQGLFASVSGLAVVLGGGIGGLVADALSLRGLYAVCGVASAAAAVVTWLTVRSQGTRTRADTGPPTG
jgi:MFS transporter, PPP family, 3-phenylpropionic acid transporter